MSVHQYKRRTYDEAKEIARLTFRAQVAERLPPSELEALRSKAAVIGGSVGKNWESLLGHIPDERMHYEFQVLELPERCGEPSPKLYARILVSRDRQSDLCVVWWSPPE
jgi:uncharacterized protein YciU (UPF0263 family)